MSDFSEAIPRKLLSQWIDAASKRSKAIQRKKGEELISAGEVGKAMYVLLSGQVEIKIGDVVLETVEAGGIIGEMALIDQPWRSASAAVTEDARLLPIGRELFLSLVAGEPAFSLFVMSTLAMRLRRANERGLK